MKLAVNPAPPCVQTVSTGSNSNTSETWNNIVARIHIYIYVHMKYVFNWPYLENIGIKVSNAVEGTII